MVKRKRRTASKTAQIRAYIAENPEVTPKKIAELYAIPVKSVYQITYQIRKEKKPIRITQTEALIANKLGVSTEFVPSNPPIYFQGVSLTQ